MRISRLNSVASPPAVYASRQYVAARHATLAPGWRTAPLPGRCRTCWLAVQGFNSSHPPCQGLPWRNIIPKEFDVLVMGGEDFIPGMAFGCTPLHDRCDFTSGSAYRVGRDPESGLPEYQFGEYTYESTGPSQCVLTFRGGDGKDHKFTLAFEPSGKVRVTISDLNSNAPVWPGMPDAGLGLAASPVLLPIPPSWSAAIAIEIDIAPEDLDSMAVHIEKLRDPDYSPPDLDRGFYSSADVLYRTLLGRVYDDGFGGSDTENPEAGAEAISLGPLDYTKIGPNRAIVTFSWSRNTASYASDSVPTEFQKELIGTTWVYDLTFTSDGAAKYTRTISKEGYRPAVEDGAVDFRGDSITVDEFPDELALPDDPPQESGEDQSGVEVAAALSATGIGLDDVQTFLVNNPGFQSVAYRPGDWLEPKDGSYQRMMIVGASQVPAAASAASSPITSRPLHAQTIKAQAPFSRRDSSPIAEPLAPLARAVSRPRQTASNSTITQMWVVCMQHDADEVPIRGARYFSRPKTAQGAVQECQKNCVLEEADNIQGCVWTCETNPGGS